MNDYEVQSRLVAGWLVGKQYMGLEIEILSLKTVFIVSQEKQRVLVS